MNKAVLKVIVGSQNPVKVDAASGAIARVFPEYDLEVLGVSAPSGVRAQPMNEEETLLGARNRVVDCQQQYKDADFYVAFEGGVENFSYGVATFAYIVVASGDKLSVGRTANLPLPQQFYSQLQQGEELGSVLDAHFSTLNIKQKGGAIGLLTRNLESRQSSYEQALVLALAPFLYTAFF